MEITEGVVVFRNRMGGTTHLRIRTAEAEEKLLGFRLATLGAAQYELVHGFDIGDGIRASGVLTADRHQRPLIDVAEFAVVRLEN